ncbi:MAG: hypothetical protein AB9879_05675 [Methanothrix sp.]
MKNVQYFFLRLITKLVHQGVDLSVRGPDLPLPALSSHCSSGWRQVAGEAPASPKKNSRYFCIPDPIDDPIDYSLNSTEYGGWRDLSAADGPQIIIFIFKINHEKLLN